MKRALKFGLILLAGAFPPGPAFAQDEVADGPVITIEGADEALTANIRNHLSLASESCDANRQRLRRLLPQVRTNIQNAANALGYYRAESTVAFEEGDASTCWSLSIQVMPGEPVVLDEVTIDIVAEDDVAAVFRDTVQSAGIASGMQLNHQAYDSFKNRLSSVAIESGFFGAQYLSSEIRLNLVSNVADIEIRFAPGERYRFGDLNIDYEGVLSQEFINRLVTFEPGAPYSNERLMQLRRNLDESQYFRQVSIRPQLSRAANQMVPVNLQLIPRLRHSYTGGIGFTTDTGPRLRLAYENRYQTRNGHRLNADLSLSTVTSQANLNYRMPFGSNPLRERILYSTGYIHEDNDSFDSNRYIVETAYENESTSGWLRETFINYQRDDYVISEAETDTTSLTLLGFGLSKTSANNLINPSRGWRISSEISGTNDSLLSDISLIQYTLSGKGILSFGDRSRILTRMEVGATWIENETDLPASLRFFAGGDRSVRGYDYQSLGPVDVDDNVVGGSHKLVGSVEYDYRFLQSWRAAVFYDAGNAFNDPSDFEFKHAAGIGIRWISPIGPIRFDVARGLDDDDADFRIHITMGPDL